jgi:hypothetical protein
MLARAAFVANAVLGGATPLWNWMGDGAPVFRYSPADRIRRKLE